MNITFIIPSMVPHGAEKVVLNLVNYFSNLDGYVVNIVILNCKKPNLINDINKNINIICINSKKVLFSIFKLKTIIKSLNSDIYISNLTHLNIIIAFLGFIMDKKVILVEHSNVIQATKNLSFLKKNMFRYLIKIAYRLVSNIITVSQYAKKELSSYVNKDKTNVINNPVYIDNENLICSNKINTKIEFLTIGRLVKAKRFDLMIESFTYLDYESKNYHLTIIGEGEEYTSLINKINIKKLDKYITIIPYQNAENLYKMYQRSNLFLVTSENESFGNTIVEALSFGLTVVALNSIGGINEILCHGKYGYICKDINPKEYANLIEDALENRFEKEILQQYAKNTFSIESIASQYENILNTIIGKNK